MTFTKWLSLSEAERETEKRRWRPFDPGYWHSLAVEAAARFNAEFRSTPHIVKVFKSLYRARELIVAVQTDLAPGKKIKLPETYLGFTVLQFANETPKGVLVDPGPPSKSSRRTKGAGPRPGSPLLPLRSGKAKAGLHRVLPLEGEIDLNVSPQITAELRALIKQNPEKLVIDLSKVSYIDSSGLAMLIDAMQQVEAYRGKLYLAGMQPDIQLIFETSRLEQAFRIRRDVAAALDAS